MIRDYEHKVKIMREKTESKMLQEGKTSEYRIL